MPKLSTEQVSDWEKNTRIQDRIDGRKMAEQNFSFFELGKKPAAFKEAYVRKLTSLVTPEVVADRQARWIRNAVR